MENIELLKNLEESTTGEMTNEEEDIITTFLRRIFDLGIWLSEKPEQTAWNRHFCGKEVKVITDLICELADVKDISENEYNDALIVVEEFSTLVSHLLTRTSDEFQTFLMDFRKEVLTEKTD